MLCKLLNSPLLLLVLYISVLSLMNTRPYEISDPVYNYKQCVRYKNHCQRRDHQLPATCVSNAFSPLQTFLIVETGEVEDVAVDEAD